MNLLLGLIFLGRFDWSSGQGVRDGFEIHASIHRPNQHRSHHDRWKNEAGLSIVES